MSGLEVIGVVLGVLPLAVQAIKGYKALLPSRRHIERDLKALIQDLETEQVCLKNTCELLLDGIAPPSTIDTLSETPFGPEWKEYDQQIRLRLWKTYGTYAERIMDMEEAAQELKQKLCLQKDGKTQLTDRHAILQELRRGASFTLKKKDYDCIVARIKAGNSILYDLATQNCGLEPRRRLRSQARLIKLVRGLSHSIFNALSLATSCRCVNSHDVCLELVYRNLVLLPSDLEDEVAKDFKFHVVFGYGSLNNKKDTRPHGKGNAVARWDSIQLQLADGDSKPVTPSSSAASTIHLSEKPQRTIKWPTSLSFKSTKGTGFSTTQTLVEKSKSLVFLPKTNSVCPSAVTSNLCQVVLDRNNNPSAYCYAYIRDVRRKFALYPRQPYIESQSPITLRQMLQEQGPGIPFLEKFKVALAISVSVLHLHQTPWLGHVLTLDDIVFLQDDNDILSTHVDSQYRPFIIKNLPNGSNTLAGGIQLSQELAISRPINLTVLSLGALLIQLIIGRVIDNLDMTDIFDMDSVLLRHKIGGQLSGTILESGSGNYLAAVKWCLENVLGIAGLDNDNFCQNLYTEVIARLEEDVKMAASG